MKAEKKYIVNKNRTKLEEVLPLTTPYSMFVDVCNACNFKCKSVRFKPVIVSCILKNR